MKKFSVLRSRLIPGSQAQAEAKEKAMLDQVLFEVDANKFKQFTDLLDAPSKANPRLRADKIGG